MKPVVNTRCEDFEGASGSCKFCDYHSVGAIVGKTQTHMMEYYNLDVV